MDRLANTVRPYAWGSTTAIPALLGEQPTGGPQAELWLGAHPGDPSRVDRGEGPRPLDTVIAADPVGELGAQAVAKFGPTLPFLLKVLAAEIPLSLQVHPDLAQARAGFAAEQAAGIPVAAGHRNYKDANHKPELCCALEEFEGFCGFRDPLATADLMEELAVPGLLPLIDLLRTKPAARALREALATLLSLDPVVVAATVTEVTGALDRLLTAEPQSPWAPAWAGYAYAAKHFPGDAGVLAALLLNHFRLRPGEAVYLGAGVPHAYLRGTCVEILANSDNVLRCGLTPKHVDVPELLKVVVFEPGDPGVRGPVAIGDGEELFPVPIDEFRLSRFTLAPGLRCEVDGRAVQILLCTEGSVTLTDGAGQALELTRGQSAYLPATGTATVLTGAGVLFRATVTL
ncbi:mannose-6-phosphate isomerase, class I [Kitasatospora sp. NBC_01287]|uniref:mannose-6-phosphate isomerase, class I n=1 Tax=Kitasatospora sp. NBC_01287 TaxID=2903573 RepID=UPI0022504A82|nr:mannose-6-phosphate isomerase, class I [Kitasatospora sp. NBC_01287]MCX4748696.1 mannose-6-phosphate isomerase, class I [Kitasatospora sp. NBC_01287]